jgi:alpha-tubulin suppressor-like RCC1 family protein
MLLAFSGCGDDSMMMTDAAMDGGDGGGDATPDGMTDAMPDAMPDASDPCAELGCMAPATCVVTDGTAMCECPDGYVLGADAISCDDIDECMDGTAMCGDAECRNTPGSYVCACDPGYYWSGTACELHGDTPVGAGTITGCEVQADNTAWCWGSNLGEGLGMVIPPARVSERTQVSTEANFRSVSSGGLGYGCSIRTDGRLTCWGHLQNQSYILVVYDMPDMDWQMVDVGAAHGCALKMDGSLHCWGDTSLGRLGDPALTDFIHVPEPIDVGTTYAHVSASDRHSCGVLADGSLKCWGRNGDGQLGDGTMTNHNVPTAVPGATDYSVVSAGARNTCGIKLDGTLWCWGDNSWGQSGWDPETTPGPVTSPMQVGTDTDWVNLAAGSHYGCALKSDHTLWCWGTLFTNSEPSVGPTQVGTDRDWDAISVFDQRVANAGFACGHRAGELYCWGSNLNGTLAIGTYGSQPTPTMVDSETWEYVSTQGRTCGIRPDGTLWCWGFAEGGPPLNMSQTPVQVGTDTDWSTVTTCGSHQCGIKDDGSLWCWGNNRDGQVGTGTISDEEPNPVQVGTDTDWEQVETGRSHTCGLKNGGELWCWGSNAEGGYGDGTTVGGGSPVRVGTDTWTSISARVTSQRTCGLRGGAVYCWGSDRGTSPVQIGTATDWDTVSDGHDDNGGCGLRGGELWCWTDTTSAPFQVGTFDDYLDGYATTTGACGRRADERLWCWRNDYAAVVEPVADRTDPDPAEVSDGVSFAQVHGNSLTVCGVLDDGSLMCWGDGLYGRLGTGEAFRTDPVPAL